jgi:tyrosyl-tRNA synthetase
MDSLLKSHTDKLFSNVDTTMLHDNGVEAKVRDFLVGKRGPLRVKVGFDPTRPDLHFGHFVLLKKMREIQDLGHVVIFLIGDYTALIGDPTGKDELRPRLTQEQVKEASSTYVQQVSRFLDKTRTEVRYNSEWLSKFTMLDTLELLSKRTVSRTLERKDFKDRLDNQKDVYMHELLYPLLQGYDSVALDADLELGGTDQMFNMGVGSDLMKKYGKHPQDAFSLPILEGTDARFVDGKLVGKKMSKSLNNSIGITEEPNSMYRKIMQIDDSLTDRYFQLLSTKTPDAVAHLKKHLDHLAFKKVLASDLVGMFHSQPQASASAVWFHNLYLSDANRPPDNMPEVSLEADAGGSIWLPKVLHLTHLVSSTSEGRRALTDGFVEIDGHRAQDITVKLKAGAYIIRVGSKQRKYVKVLISAKKDELHASSCKPCW